MTIAEFIRDSVLQPRLKMSGCLVVYDADKRYRDQCLALASDTVRMIDASLSSIESREAALRALREVGLPQAALEAVLIYVPARRPETDEQKQVDPFALFAECGAVFPRDDGDEYLSICLRAKPDHATQIRKVFGGSQSAPSFAVIDAIGGGVNWPQLRATLRVESAREILLALLAPTGRQREALKDQGGWVEEVHDFLKATLSMSLKTRAKTWTALADELWRFVLFSEFVFDLPEPLPETLSGVPRAPSEAAPIVEDVCDGLRADPKWRAMYVERAESIETELNLAALCSTIEDLGKRDTFPFEVRTFLRAAVRGITTNDTDAARRVLSSHTNSVWLGKGEIQAQWELLQASLSLVEACEDFDRQLPEHSRTQSDLLDFYVGSLREVDRLQREFEQSVGDFLDQNGLMDEVIQQARAQYRRLAEKVEGIFIKHIETAGWPPAGRLANADTFDQFVADKLSEGGHRVAYLMVDALRYELGVALENLLSEDGPIELRAAHAQLPTITPVGMASLLPGASANLTLTLAIDALVPRLSGAPVTNVTQRMDVLKQRFGDRFAEMTLGDFARGKPKIDETVDLLVLRSTEIDSQLENNPETTLGLIPGTLKLIRVALHRLRGMGFSEAIIATDHGFFLNAQAEAGDVCLKPQGAWPINAHDRMMLGDGSGDAHSMVATATKLGVRGDFAQLALPRSMAPYRAGHLYFHGGASLAEAVVPVLIARLDSLQPVDQRRLSVQLAYKNGAKRIATRLPVIDVMLVADDIFAHGTSVDVLLEAQDTKGNVVGEPRAGGDVDPATRTLTLKPGEQRHVVIRMDDEFRGKFTIKALNPTTLAAYSSLTIETDYVE